MTRLQFFAHSRHGVSALPSDGLDPATGRRTTNARVFVVTRSEQGGTEAVVSGPTAGVGLLGPGDVVGLDGEQVLRRVPRPGATDVDPNDLAFIELAHPDLPWLFTAHVDGAVPVPWLMLLVLDDPDGTRSARRPGRTSRR